MPSFNANAFMAKASKTIDELSDQLAFEIGERLNELTTDEMTSMMEALLAVVRNKDETQRLIRGEFAQNNTGQPALQLGGGSAAKKPLDQAYDIIQADPTVPVGLKMALSRMAVPSAPDYIKVDDDGTPVVVGTLTKQVTDLTNERNTLRAAGENFTELLDAIKAVSGLNPNPVETPEAFVRRAFKTKATPVPPADMVLKADVQKAADEALKAVQAEKAPTIGKVIEGRDAALKAVQAVVDLAK